MNTFLRSPFSQEDKGSRHNSLPPALKTRLGLILAKAVAMRVMINATGCPAPVSDRASMKTHARISDLIASAIDHDLHTPV